MPPSVKIFAAMPPPAPEPTTITSYVFGDRIICAIKPLPCVRTSLPPSTTLPNCTRKSSAQSLKHSAREDLRAHILQHIHRALDSNRSRQNGILVLDAQHPFIPNVHIRLNNRLP